MTPVRGQLHDPVAGVTRAVDVSWDPAGRALRIAAEAGARSVPAARLSLSGGGWQKQDVHLSWTEDGRAWAVTISEPAALESLAAALPAEYGSEIRRLIAAGVRERRRGRRTLVIVAALLLFPVLALGAAFLLRDRLIGLILRRLPTTVDAQLGELAFRQVGSTGKLLASGPAVEAVHALGERLIRSAPSHPYRFRFEVVRDPSINAFAAPGGLVVVHTGLLAAAASPDEVAGVLAHEITHVLERHSLRQLVFQAGMAGAVRLLIGAPEGAAEVLTGATMNLTALRFSRDQEQDADRGGLDLLRRARLPAEGLVRFFDRLAERGGALPPLLSSHPAADDRAVLLAAELTHQGEWPVEALPVDWQAVQTEARSSR